MGVDANGLLTSNPSPIEIMDFLEGLDYVKNTNITPTSVSKFVYVNFTWFGEQRNMAVFYDGKCKCDYETIWPHDAAFVSIGKWGMSHAIIMSLVNKFGGFYRLNDCTDEWKGV